MKLSSSALLLVAAAAATTAVSSAQFTCTIKGGGSSDVCVAETDNDGSHCVWCAVSSFGFCTNEATAESIEKTLPTAECDRYQPDDDKAPSSDDDTTPPDSTDDDTPPPNSTDDDTPPPPDSTDDKIAPTDDSLPDNYWKCLQDTDAKTCASDDCTWCTSKAGFSLCVTGPTADFAKKSDFFTCAGGNETETVQTYLRRPVSSSEEEEEEAIEDPYDASCLTAYLNDPTETGCSEAVDEDGTSCEWCTLAGMANICLTKEQAELGRSGMGIQCDEKKQMQTTESVEKVTNPYDTSCMLAFFQDQSKNACTTAEDEDGNPCDFCTLQGSIELCLTEDQAQVAQQLGADCGDDNDKEVVVEAAAAVVSSSPYDTSCIMAFFQDQTKEACVTAADEDGTACEFCSLGNGQINLCLTETQAEAAGQLGADCGEENNKAEEVSDLYDKSCAMNFLQDGTKEGCQSTKDQSGTDCKWCHGVAIQDVCLTAEQGDAMTQLGFWCDGENQQAEKDAAEALKLPDDFFTCLLHYEEGDCSSSSCTWCHTQVGFDICMAPAAADATKQCPFFDCEESSSTTTKQQQQDPYDPTCLSTALAGQTDDAKETCHATNDRDGQACVWCEAANLVGLCLTSDQAGMAGSFVQCEENSQFAVVAAE